MRSTKLHLLNFNDCHNFKELWESLHYQLKPYKIKSIFYGLTYSRRSVEEIGILKSIVYKTSHPKEYRTILFEALFPKKTDKHYPNLQFLLDEDVTAKKIFLSDKEYFLWADPTEWDAPTPIEKEIDQKLIDMQLVTGVTLPIKNSKFIAGIGLSVGNLSAKQFKKIWQESSQYIIELVQQFNKLVQDQYLRGMINLTSHQQQVFQDYFYHNDLDALAVKYRCTKRNILDILQKVRVKLNAQNYKQAAVKAYALGVIDLA